MAADATVVGEIESFDSIPLGSFQKGFLDTHRWTEEIRQQARSWSSLEIVPEGPGRALRVRVTDPQVLTPDAKSVARLAPFFPPQADAVRIRLKVVSGQVSIYVGGPTAYYGNSDVFTEPQTIRAAAKPEWVEIVCNFNHPTWRNYRRSGFSTDAPRNYYSRWAQEPMGIYLAPGSLGEILIDRVDLLALGEGKPFAEFTTAQVRQVQDIADFEDGKLDGTFNLYMAAAEAEWFEESWRRSKPLRFEPMALTVIEGGLDGRKSLQCRGRTAEEVHCTGVRTRGADGANAVAITLHVEAPEQRNTLVSAGPVVPVDFLIFVAPTDAPFPWQRFAPSDELRARGGSGFDFQFTHRLISNYTGVDLAIYQARRYLKPGEWEKLVLPAADFTCVYGHGSMRERFLEHKPLHSNEVIAVSWLNPWCRAGRRDAPVVTRVDEISFVDVLGSVEEHRSFWQAPDATRLLHRDDGADGRRVRHVWLPEDKVPTPPK
jgi:hypothetical protein